MSASLRYMGRFSFTQVRFIGNKQTFTGYVGVVFIIRLLKASPATQLNFCCLAMPFLPYLSEDMMLYGNAMFDSLSKHKNENCIHFKDLINGV